MLIAEIAGSVSPGVLMILGLGVFGGMAGAWFFQKIHFPQVVGYIVIGLLLGETGFGLVHPADVENLRLLNLFALGIIGFLVGGELKLEMFRKYAKEVITILLGEGIAAFFLVALASWGIIYAITGEMAASLAGGVIFGAIASATDPASTIDVIWEYRAKGVMTTAIIAIVALDDALALTLYGIGTSSAQLLTSHSGSVWNSLQTVGIELFGALGLGAAFAVILIGFLRYQAQSDRAVALSVGVILLVIGFAAYYNLDVILAAMMVGFILINFAPRRSEEIFKLLRSFAIPIYVLFFVFVGARLSVWNMPGWLWGIVAVYVIGRSLGKWGGSWLGAKLAGSADSVRKYLGFGMIVYVVTATTLVVQLLGPYMVKVALKRSGEAGRDITEVDIINSFTVSDVMTHTREILHENMPLSCAFEKFREMDYMLYPVVDENDRVTGVLTFEALKNVAADYAVWDWMLVADAMQPLTLFAQPDQPLKSVVDTMQAERIYQMVVVDNGQNLKSVGLLDRRVIHLKIQNELVLRTSDMEKKEASA